MHNRSLPRTCKLAGLLLSFLSFACDKQEEITAAAPTTDRAPASPADTKEETVAQESAANAPRTGLLAVGDLAPDFEKTSHRGELVRLKELRGKVVILYFYPKDGTPGCTTEARGFRDQHAVLNEAGAVVLGVSTQDNESHRAFAEKHGLPFLLLPDEDASLARSYGVGSIFGFSKRVTFVIDREGKIAKVYERVSPPGHAEEIRQDILQLSR